jgi:integrase
VLLDPRLQTAVTEWLAKGAADSAALFLDHRGGRPPTRTAHTVSRAIADAAESPSSRDGVLTAHVLVPRGTSGPVETRPGADIVVAELLGHLLETVRRHGLPTHHDRRKAIEGPNVDDPANRTRLAERNSCDISFL